VIRVIRLFAVNVDAHWVWNGQQNWLSTCLHAWVETPALLMMVVVGVVVEAAV